MFWNRKAQQREVIEWRQGNEFRVVETAAGFMLQREYYKPIHNMIGYFPQEWRDVQMYSTLEDAKAGAMQHGMRVVHEIH